MIIHARLYRLDRRESEECEFIGSHFCSVQFSMYQFRFSPLEFSVNQINHLILAEFSIQLSFGNIGLNPEEHISTYLYQTL